MKVIVIGMDNTGKSTLCENLAKELKLEHLHSLGYKPSKETLLNFMAYNLTNEKDVIFERFSFFDEIIYGPVLRYYTKFNIGDDFYYNLLEKEPYIIYCRPEDNVIFNWGNREQMDGVIEHEQELLNRWDALVDILKEDGFKVIDYDYTKDSTSKLIKEIKGEEDVSKLGFMCTTTFGKNSK